MPGSDLEARVAALGLELPPPPKPGGVYRPVVVSGSHAYVSGHGPLKADGTYITGRVGADLDVQAGRAAARQTALAILASLRHALGSLDRVTGVVKLLGMVNAAPGFGETPQVVHGATEFYYEVFGDKGKHARSAVGMQALPSEVPVEIETIFEIEA